jgi:hypothetical protein
MMDAARRFTGPGLGLLAGAGLEVSGFEDTRFALGIWAFCGLWALLALITWPPVAEYVPLVGRHMRTWGAGALQVTPRIADEWALLDVLNLGPRRAALRAEGRIVRGSMQLEEAYPIQWRESDQAEVAINGGGGSQTLNVASASTGLLPGQRPTDLRYREFTFHTARIPVRQGEYSESFLRWQDDDEGFVLSVTITSDPPLDQQFQRHYRLRAAENPDTVWVKELTDEALTEGARKGLSPKVEFQEITFDEEGHEATSLGRRGRSGKTTPRPTN